MFKYINQHLCTQCIPRTECSEDKAPTTDLETEGSRPTCLALWVQEEFKGQEPLCWNSQKSLQRAVGLETGSEDWMGYLQMQQKGEMMWQREGTNKFYLGHTNENDNNIERVNRPTDNEGVSIPSLDEWQGGSGTCRNLKFCRGTNLITSWFTEGSFRSQALNLPTFKFSLLDLMRIF